MEAHTGTSPPPSRTIRVLLVDDDVSVRQGFTRLLKHAGYAVTCEGDVPDARARLASGERFDVVLTDLNLPNGTGLDVLSAAHGIDPTLPVLIATGSRDLNIAGQAVSHGALRFLTKPVESDRLLGAIAEACRMRTAVAAALGHQPSISIRRLDPDLVRLKSANAFDGARDALWLALQPVVSVTGRTIVGYEALLRSDHPTMSRADLILQTAEDLGRLTELGRVIRRAAADRIAELPPGADMLVNVHASDLEDPDLYDEDSPLATLARRVILEITERASFTHLPDLSERLDTLRKLGFRLAIDDLGAGYGSLSALALVRPDLVKLDMSLVRGIDGDPVRRQVVRSLGIMCKQLETTWLCEGVETPAELRVLVDAGAELIQGYLVGRPNRAVTEDAPQALSRALSDS